MANNINGLFETLSPSQEQKDRILNSIVSNVDMADSNPKHFVKFLKPITAMALICLVVIGGLFFNSFFNSSDSNEFTIKVYAIDTEDGQSAMRPIDGDSGAMAASDEWYVQPSMRPVNDDSGAMVAADMWFGYYEYKGDTVSIYIDVGWQIEGENIKTAVITVNDGYFLHKLGKYEFEEIGNSVVLDKDDIHKGDMLYVGYDRPVTYVEREITYHGRDAQTGETWDGTRMETVPEHEWVDAIILRAVVTYDNGEIEEKEIVFNSEDVRGRFSYEMIGDLPY